MIEGQYSIVSTKWEYQSTMKELEIRILSSLNFYSQTFLFLSDICQEISEAQENRLFYIPLNI